MTCPFCGSKNVDVPTVDIGVGEQQCGPAVCIDCDAAQDSDGKWRTSQYWIQKRIEGARSDHKS